ncbi:MAG TPA: oligosaccharide flippase family protein [Burkholderiales bacterium]|nr:oligosaccharide flippase family protein [Burkholderiales bacterium]
MLTNRFGRGVFWNLVATALAQGSVFVANIVLARLLGKEVFGELGIVQSTMLTLVSIAQLATGITATKYVAEFRDADKERAGRILGFCSVITFAFGLVAALTIGLSSDWLAAHILKNERLSSVILIAAPFVLFSAMNGYQIGALVGLEAYKRLSVLGAGLGLAHIVVCTVAAVNWGLEGAVAGLVLSSLLRWCVHGLALSYEARRRNIPIRRTTLTRDGAMLLSFSVPAAISGMTSMAAIWAGNALLVRQSDGYAQMGLYTAATTIRMLVMLTPLIFTNVAMAILNNHRGNRLYAQYEQMFWTNVWLNGLIALAAATVIALTGRLILLLFGAEFQIGYGILLVLMAATVPEALAVAVAQAAQSQQKMWQILLFIALPRDVLFLSVALALVPSHGALGLAAAYVVGQICALASVTLLVRSLGITGRT